MQTSEALKTTAKQSKNKHKTHSKVDYVTLVTSIYNINRSQKLWIFGKSLLNLLHRNALQSSVFFYPCKRCRSIQAVFTAFHAPHYHFHSTRPPWRQSLPHTTIHATPSALTRTININYQRLTGGGFVPCRMPEAFSLHPRPRPRAASNQRPQTSKRDHQPPHQRWPRMQPRQMQSPNHSINYIGRGESNCENRGDDRGAEVLIDQN